MIVAQVRQLQAEKAERARQDEAKAVQAARHKKDKEWRLKSSRSTKRSLPSVLVKNACVHKLGTEDASLQGPNLVGRISSPTFQSAAEKINPFLKPFRISMHNTRSSSVVRRENDCCSVKSWRHGFFSIFDIFQNKLHIWIAHNEGYKSL